MSIAELINMTQDLHGETVFRPLVSIAEMKKMTHAIDKNIEVCYIKTRFQTTRVDRGDQPNDMRNVIQKSFSKVFGR
jgi:hypothetical protein